MSISWEQKRFSQQYGGKSLTEWPMRRETRENGAETVVCWRLEDGLVVTNVFRQCAEFSACEWVTWLENTGTANSKMISSLWDCDVALPWDAAQPDRHTAYLPAREDALQVYCPKGADNNREAFSFDLDALNDSANRYACQLYPGQKRAFATTGGRSSNSPCAPFFGAHQNGHGVIFAIGWTGQWHCEIARGAQEIAIRTGIEGARFFLKPGEKLRTSSFVLMEYEGDILAGHNQWRRLVKARYSLIGAPGREVQMPLCTGLWGGMSTESALRRLATIRNAALPFEYIWMDAGWYGGAEVGASPDEFEGDWGMHTGDWRVNRAHPDGLVEVSAAIHDMGMKYILWFEPERVVRGTPITREHPEYLIPDPNGGPFLLLDLGNPDAWQYCFDTLANFIEKLRIDCLRQDFNFEPLPYWRSKDEPDRQGVAEIRHILGLYRLWDALLTRFPHLIIDNCASGGRRIDIETLRRSVPLWRNDGQCPANFPAELNQAQGINYAWWLPYSGTGTGRPWGDIYRTRSSYAPGLTTNFAFSERDAFGAEAGQLAWIAKFGAEYLRVRPYLTEDFYPLTSGVSGDDAWCAVQYHRSAQGDGILQAFRRALSPYTAARFALRGLQAEKTYCFEDADTGETVCLPGDALMHEGLPVEILERRTARLFFYRPQE